MPVHCRRIHSPRVRRHLRAPLARPRVPPALDPAAEELLWKRQSGLRRRVPAQGRRQPPRAGARHRRRQYRLDVAAMTQSSLLHTAVSIMSVMLISLITTG